MVEVAKPDYLSLVNQGGSGFNISELVTSIVAAEIEPKKALNESKKNDADNAISGIGFLNSQSSVTKTAFDTRMTDKFFNVSSSNSAVVEFSSTDEMKLQPSQTEISNVSLAKKMVFELPGFTDLSSTINQAISIDFGSWVQTSTAASSASSTVESGKTYTVTTRSGSAGAASSRRRGSARRASRSRRGRSACPLSRSCAVSSRTASRSHRCRGRGRGKCRSHMARSGWQASS